MHDSPIRTRNRFSPTEENSSVRRESGANSVDDAESRQHISHDTTLNDADTTPNDTRSQTPHWVQNLTESSGEPPQSRPFDIAQGNLLVHTFMTRMDRQSEAHTMAIRECMSQSMSMMKDTCESIKECVTLVADSTQANFQQLADSTQNNFQQLLGEVRKMRDDRAHTAFSLPNSTQIHSLMSNAMSSEARTITLFDRSHGLVGFTSLAQCPSAVPSLGFLKVGRL